MWKSFVYKDFDWTLNKKEDQPTLEIKAKNSNRQPTCVFTKQVSFVLFRFFNFQYFFLFFIIMSLMYVKVK